MLYLTDVEEGGETMFPYEVSARKFLYVFLVADCNEYCAGLQNSENMDIGYDYEKCIGLKVKPRKGDGLLFYSLMVNGTIDRVRAGLSKWALYLCFPFSKLYTE